MTVGGPGFYVLHWKDTRLAYLQIDPLRSPYNWVGRHRDATQVGFYEMWNEEQWLRLLGTDPEPLVALQCRLDAGELKLLRIISSPVPSEGMRQIEADLTGVRLRALSDEMFTVAGGELPKYLALDSPHTITESDGRRSLPRKGTLVSSGTIGTTGTVSLTARSGDSEMLLARLRALVTDWDTRAETENPEGPQDYSACAQELQAVLDGTT